MKLTDSKYEIDNVNIQIQQSKDYGMFKKLETNRDLNHEHVLRLENSMKRGYLISPVTVNENFEIIDGQHRFTAAQNLGLPIYYYVVKGYGMEEVKVLNTTVERWSKRDFLRSYAKMGIEPYVQMEGFMNTFPDFKISTAEAILTNRGHTYAHALAKNFAMRHAFEEGRLEIPNLELAYENAKKLMQIKPYYFGFMRRSFVAAMMQVFRLSGYDHDHFIKQLSSRSNLLQDRINIYEYRSLIGEIYNYRLDKKDRIRF